MSDSVTLIVVEDKPLVREQTTAVLERAGYRLVPIADGQAAIDELTGRAGPVDVLVADVVMPDVSGLELAEAIIERDPRVGLVLLSRYDETTLDVAHIKSHGAVFELTPIGSPGLLEAVLSATPVKQDG